MPRKGYATNQSWMRRQAKVNRAMPIWVCCQSKSAPSGSRASCSNEIALGLSSPNVVSAGDSTVPRMRGFVASERVAGDGDYEQSVGRQHLA